MKKIIRYLAKQTGVYSEAYRHGVKDAGANIKSLSFFMNHRPDIKTALIALSENMVEHGDPTNAHYMKIKIDLSLTTKIKNDDEGISC